jgi:putative ABC transport system ATP-binding protein
MTLLMSNTLAVLRKDAPPLWFEPVSVRAGETTLLLGPSGSGKTTLLSVLAGLLKPDEGRVTLDGQDLYALPARKRDRARGRNYGFVFQTLHLLPALSLRRNIALAAAMAGLKPDAARIERLIGALGLEGKAHRRPDALSQGEQQRAAIARAVLNGPRIILADEPTSALDDANAETVMTLLTQQARETGAALLVATHDHRITSHFKNVVRLETAAAKEQNR